ncbi:Sodium/hydrogen exchanger 9B2 [Taenia crassiceps]|uniref:Sodium/hydrogen exchanger 9B2 n=1 Tax=Taenia crassiceps TaxID=6207 RepID=A0ABR4Q641_9CEST
MQNLSVDLPTLPEDRLFDPHSASDNENRSRTSANASITIPIRGRDDVEVKSFNKIKPQKRSCFRCTPPHWLRHASSWTYRHVGGVAAYIVFFLLIYTLLWIFTGEEALPPRCYAYQKLEEGNTKTEEVAVCYGGTTLGIVIFYAFAFTMGQLVEFVRLPGLLGMLMSGLILRCISVFITPYEIFMGGPPTTKPAGNTTSAATVFYSPLISLTTSTFSDAIANTTQQLTDPLIILAAMLRVNKALSSALRQIALATILTRAGLGLEPATLKRIWTSMIRLTCIPCLTEALVCTLVSKFLMNWPWPWAAMMGFILAAVSPAVVVPNMLRLEVSGWGVAAGIPTLVMAASSLDDVLAITGFGISQAIAFAQGDIVIVAISGPLEVLAGACLGVCLAIIFWLLPPPGMEHSNSLRGILLYSVSIAAIIGTIKMGLPGAGALCCLVCSLTCSAGWQHGMPWRFKHKARSSTLTAQPSIDEYEDEENSDLEANRHNDLGHRRGSDSLAEGSESVPTEHHEYYRQHLRSLRRLLKRTGGVGSKNALATVSKSRRFSLPEPKPQYEEDDFEMADMKRRRGKLTRSLSASRSSTTTKVDRKRTVSEIIRSDMAVAEGVSGGVEKKMSGGEDSHLSVVAVNTSSSVVAAAAAAAAAVGGGVGGGRGGVGGELEVRTARSAYGKTSEDLQTEALATLLVLDKAKGLECLKVMRGYMATCWWFVQPLLFCLIGADIPVEKLRADTIGRGIASILISLSFRMGASILAVTPSPLKWKERIFVAVAWIPKATVQAAIGPLALDSARATGDRTLINWGEQIITLSALSILLTAPLAALLIPLVAPHLLHQDPIFIPVGSSTANHNDNAYADNDEESEDGHKRHHHRIGRGNKKGIDGVDDETKLEAGGLNKADGILRGLSEEENEGGAPSTLETAL